jgi:hypothetical protein
LQHHRRGARAGGRAGRAAAAGPPGAGYFRDLRQVLVYPGPFVVDRPQADRAVVQDARRVLAGESWQQGQLILSAGTTCWPAPPTPPTATTW